MKVNNRVKCLLNPGPQPLNLSLSFLTTHTIQKKSSQII